MEVENARHPIGRIGTLQDVNNAVAFLASDQASWMTGELMYLDGGRHLKTVPTAAAQRYEEAAMTDTSAK